MGKHRENIYQLLSKKEIKSTNEIVKEMQEKTGKTMNWHLIYRELMELDQEGKIEKLSSKGGLYWRKK